MAATDFWMSTEPVPPDAAVTVPVRSTAPPGVEKRSTMVFEPASRSPTLVNVQLIVPPATGGSGLQVLPPTPGINVSVPIVVRVKMTGATGLTGVGTVAVTTPMPEPVSVQLPATWPVMKQLAPASPGVGPLQSWVATVFRLTG